MSEYSEHKGIDDLLAAGGRPRRLRGEAVAAFFAAARDRLFGRPARSGQPARVTPALPPFPVDVFPEPVARFVNRVAAAMGCPPDFPGVGVLVVAGAAAGAARSLQVKGGWEEKGAMYAVVVSRPGTTKTPALKAVMAPVYEEQDRLSQDHRAAMREYEGAADTYRRRLRARDGGETAPPQEPPPLRHLFAADTTVEELANNLKDNAKGLLLFRDELSAFVRGLDQYKGRGNDRQFFLSAWSGEMVKVDRKSSHGQPTIIPYPFVGVLGGIQPDLLTELEAEGGREDGFLHRLLFCIPPDAGVRGWIEDELTEDDEMEWQLVVSRLLSLQPSRPEGGSERPRRLPFSPDGRRAFAAWCDSQAAEMNDPDFPPVMLGPCAKLRSYCARFALVIHLLRAACGEVGSDRDEGPVDAEDVGRAAKLCDYFRAHARAVYARLRQTRGDEAVDQLVRWMRRRNMTTCTVREVCRANVAGVSKRSEAEQLFLAAADRHYGEVGVDPKAGGPARTRRADWFRIFPAVPGSGAVTPPDTPDNPTGGT